MIYFDENKQAFMQEIDNPLCVITNEDWAEILPNDKIGVEWDIVDRVFVNYKNTQEYKENKEKEKEEAEKLRVQMLNLTRGDVFRGLLQAKGVTREQLRQTIVNNEDLSTVQKELALIDFDEALNFYRGNPLIDTVGLTLGITSEQLTAFFETNDYKKLIEE